LTPILGRLRALWPSRVRSIPARQFAFIITYGRSGSTLLQKILASAQGCHFTGENCDALAGLYASYRSAVAAKREEGAEPRESTGDPWRGAHLINPERYNRKLIAAFIEEIIRPPKGVWLIGFKEIRYFDHDDLEGYLDYIRLAFAPALLIFNRRNAEDVARSGWWRHHAADIATKVRRFDERTANYAALHKADTICADYDAYSKDPRELVPLFNRLGIVFSESAIAAILREKLTH
jgi:hypothetical protein